MKNLLISILLFNLFFSAFAQENIETKKDENKVVTVYWAKTSSVDIDLDELSDLVLIDEDDIPIESFKFKMPGIPTHSVNGNKLTTTIIESIKGFKKEKSFMIFSANISPKDVHGSKPVFFSIN